MASLDMLPDPLIEQIIEDYVAGLADLPEFNDEPEGEREHH